MRLSVLVPARNEADTIEPCLRSLAGQSEDGFRLGREWELLLADDGSTDGTGEIAAQIGGVTLLHPAEPPPGWTGKANAVWVAAAGAQGEWLLFTDADTVHEPGSLLRALHEAEDAGAAMLSYSPRQEVTGFWQRALMPLIFSELARAYPPAKVSDPASPVAAANGQFLMVRREAYFRIGGHRAVAGSMLEDVDLARLFKQAGLPVRFRYAPDAVSTRMYRGFGQMYEGWTKNLALLFRHPLALAAWRALDPLLLAGLPVAVWACAGRVPAQTALGLAWLAAAWRFQARVARSNFPAGDCAMAVCGVPLFCLLLLRSWFHHKVRKQVVWKERAYPAQPGSEVR